jgi:hypothetical protein
MIAGTIPEDLIRLSVGIENVSDLLADLVQALELATHPHVMDVRSMAREGSATAAAKLLHDAAAMEETDLPLPSVAETKLLVRRMASMGERLEEALERQEEAERRVMEAEKLISRAIAIAAGVTLLAISTVIIR